MLQTRIASLAPSNAGGALEGLSQAVSGDVRSEPFAVFSCIFSFFFLGGGGEEEGGSFRYPCQGF